MKLPVPCLLIKLLLLSSFSLAQECPISLLWSDEFDGTELDATKWTPQEGDGCALGADLCGWGNAELQYYRAENAAVSNGTLKITAKEEAFGGRQYTSARIRTLGKVDIDLTLPHLRIESRIKVPRAEKSMWPAFWMLPSNLDVSQWPLGGEIDAMEFIGREPNNAHGYLHYGNAWNDRTVKGGPIRTPSAVGDDFHVFAIEKTPNKIDFLLDGHWYQSYSSADVEPNFNWPFENTFHFILNLAIGGHWPEYPNEATVFPNTMEVDYVRVYDFENATFGQVTGNRLVHVNQTNEEYCIIQDGVAYDTITWTVPEGASFVESAANCITVAFGSTSGNVQAVAQSTTCDIDQTFRVPVEVQPFYKKEFSLLEPGSNDQATIMSYTGTLNVVNDTIEYTRNISEVYDHIQLNTTSIVDPQLYISQEHKFFMNLKSPTAAPCTRILIQLEDSTTSLPDNYPAGRHSRYIAFLEGTGEWQRLEFDFYDQPQLNVGRVDRILILLDSFVERADEYSIRNLDSAVLGCMEDCEALSTNECRKRAKSEAGACTDGINNDGVGYDGDGTIDCDDSDCWNDPACLAPGTTVSPTTTAPATTTQTPVLSPTPVEVPIESSVAPSVESETSVPTSLIQSAAPTEEATSGAHTATDWCWLQAGLLSLFMCLLSVIEW